MIGCSLSTGNIKMTIETVTGLEIAVIGMSGRFPGAKNIDRFWENLKNGVDSISFFSDEELLQEGIDPQLLKNPHYVKAKGSLADIEYFDADFFGFTPRDADIMDPQVRFFLECSWEALENAGYVPDTYDGLIGVYAGASENITWRANLVLSDGTRSDKFMQTFYNSKDFMALLLSYKLNLTGPSFVIFTACSTSLVAIHTACQSLLNGECDMALAGGVKISIPNKDGYLYQPGMINSPDGHCRAFDANAQGTIPGSGVGIVILKRLAEALADGNHIHAVIKGSAVNNDGLRKIGFTAPSIAGQAQVIRTALQMAQIEPESISYIETHGTATELGDPVEIEGLKSAFKTAKKNGCAIGSVKTNLGHLDTAAGVAGFIKTVLALEHKYLPPSLYYSQPNPKIDFENSPFYVNSQPVEWKTGNRPRRAGVSSFGIGGTNAHIILEEAPDAATEPSPPGSACQLLLLSAKTPSALARMTQNLSQHLENNPGLNIADAAYTLTLGRKHFKHRKMTVCSSLGEAQKALSTPGSPAVRSSVITAEKMPVVFMFPGQGSQYVEMGIDLYHAEPLFRREMDRCFAVIKSLDDSDIKEILYPAGKLGQTGLICSAPPPEENNRIQQTENAQVIIFIFQYALAKLLIAWGIEPYAMIGHSIGEYTAACLAGVFVLEDALKTVVLRGKLMQQMPPGVMLSVPLPEDQIKPLLSPGISLAAVNSTAHCVVSGAGPAVASFKRKLLETGCESSYLHTSHAFHSTMMEPILADFTKQINQIKLNEPQIPYISNLTGKWISPAEAGDPTYWSKHIRETVRFSQGIETLTAQEQAVFIEIGPGNTLSTFVRQHKNKKNNHHVIDIVRHPKEQVMDDYFLLNKIGQLWLHGAAVDWEKYYAGQTRHRIPLPTYSFEPWAYKAHRGALLSSKVTSPRNNPDKKKKSEEWFYIPSWKRSTFTPANEPGIPGDTTWLIFMDDGGVGAQLIERLGKNNPAVIQVKPGPAFAALNGCDFTINPNRSDDYIRLYAELAKAGKIPDRIIQLWGLINNHIDRYDAPSLTKSLNLNFYSLIYLVQAIGKDITKNIKIEVITTSIYQVNSGETLHPEKATVLGPCKTIPQEYPNIKCRCIDIIPPGRKKQGEPDTIDRLFTEVTVDFPDTVVAHRNGDRWVQIFEPLRLTESLEKVGAAKLKQSGVYLITGGTGKVGYIFAEYLAREFHAKLILTGLSEFPPREKWEQWLAEKGEDNTVSRKIKNMKELEKLGGDILVFSADVADEKQMQKVIVAAERKFGPLNGVIHAAGVIAGPSVCFIAELDKARCQTQFQPKIMGLLTLEKILAKKELDFCILTSSLSAILGGVGFLAYAAANIFMDAYTHYHNSHNNHNNHNKKTATPSWLSVNWEGWKSPGSKTINKDLRGTPAGLDLEPAEGISAFLRILSCRDTRQIINSTGDLDARINRWIKLETQKVGEGDAAANNEPSETFQQRPNTTIPYTAPRSEVEIYLCEVWKKLFGFELIGIDDDFYEIGGDSLKAVTLAAQIKSAGYPIILTDILVAPTIRKLSLLIEEKKIPKKSAAEIYEESVLNRLECIEKLNKGRNTKNIFIVHPMHGMVNQYRELAILLGEEYNVYGIQARGVKPGTQMAENPGQLIIDYLEQIMTVQKEGPYIIAGYCAGTIIAYEIVRRLENLGHQVEKLILFDSMAFFSKSRVALIWILKYLPGFGSKALLSALDRKFKKAVRAGHPGEIHGNDAEGENQEDHLRKEKVTRNIRFLVGYIISLELIKAPILVPLAVASTYARASEEDFNKMTQTKATVVRLPGDHDSIWEKPQVNRLAEIIKTY